MRDGENRKIDDSSNLCIECNLNEEGRIKMNKEQKIWFLISTVSGITFISLLTMAAVYNIRFKYGLYAVLLMYGITFTGFIMYALTRYMSTKEITSILAKKISEW